MKKLVLIALLAGAQASQALALDLGPPAEPSCAQVICLSPAPGTPAPSECFPVRQAYFNIRVYKHGHYNPPLTAEKRRLFLQTCLTALSTDISRITLLYGQLFDDPRSY